MMINLNKTFMRSHSLLSLLCVYYLCMLAFCNSRFNPRSFKHSNPLNAKPKHMKHKFMGGANSMMDSGASVSGVYGIAGPSYIDGANSLVKYDTRTGNVTTIIAQTNPQLLTGEELGCFDSVNDIWYFVTETFINDQLMTGLYPYNLKSPSVQLPLIVLPMVFADMFVGAGDACVGDPKNGDIYLFGHDNQNMDEQLLVRVSRDAMTMNTTVSVIQSYPEIDDIPLLSGQPTIFDSKRNKLWVAGSCCKSQANVSIYYFYIDVSTGVIEKNVSYEQWPIPTCEYNAQLDLLVGMSWDGQDDHGYYKYQLRYADPVTLAVVKEFDPFDDNWCGYGPVDTMDAVDNIWYSLIYENADQSPCAKTNGTLFGYLVGVNITSGTVLSDPQICDFGADLTAPWALQYWNGQ